jgi:hypothetical protein
LVPFSHVGHLSPMTVPPGPLGGLSPTLRPVLDGWLREVGDAHGHEVQATHGRDVAGALARMGVRDLRDLSPSALSLYRAELVLAGDRAFASSRRLVMLRSFLRYAWRVGACPLLPPERVDQVLPLQPSARDSLGPVAGQEQR